MISQSALFSMYKSIDSIRSWKESSTNREIKKLLGALSLRVLIMVIGVEEHGFKTLRDYMRSDNVMASW